ncbi:MAG: hypothetical protein JJU02_14885, partial [Cryomorphaceae bacterium]|nr:hypothetical protein [Cryomorphaceae bacterium]
TNQTRRGVDDFNSTMTGKRATTRDCPYNIRFQKRLTSSLSKLRPQSKPHPTHVPKKQRLND